MSGRLSGIKALYNVSPALSKIVGSKTPMTRSDAVKKFWDYVKVNNLQNPTDKRVILADKVISTALGKEKIHLTEVMGAISPHLTKA
jgi:DNA topoisomerase-3